MADPIAPQQPQQQQQSASLFSRRPSFFGGKSSKTRPKSSRSSISHSLLRSSTSPPPSLASGSLPVPNIPAHTQTTPLDPFTSTASSAATTTTPPRHTSRLSIASSVTDFSSQLRRSRSASLRTNTSTATAATASTSSHRTTPSATLALTYSPEKAPNVAPTSSRPALSISTFSRNKQKSSENVRPDNLQYEKSPLSAVDKPKTPFAMAVPMPLRHQPTQKDIINANRQANAQLAPAAPIQVPNGTNPHIIFQHIQEMASKRISTLDYLRKAYDCCCILTWTSANI